MIAPGTVVQWHDHSTATRRLGTVASVRQSRKGPVYRVHEGNGSTGEPATYCASRNARGVLDFPGDVLTPYRRQWWPNPTPGGPALDHDPATTCPECGSPDAGGACDADCPTRGEDERGPVDADGWPIEDEPAPSPALPPLVFVNVRDLDSGDGSPLALF